MKRKSHSIKIVDISFQFICLIASIASSEAGLLSFQPAEVHSAPLALRSAPLFQSHHTHLTHVTDLHNTHAFHTVPLTQAGPLAQVSSLVHSPPLNQLDAAHLIHFASPAQVPISPLVHEILPQVTIALCSEIYVSIYSAI